MANQLITSSEVEQERGATLRVWLDKPEIIADLGNSLSGWMDPEVFKSQIVVSLNDEKIAHCSPQSKYRAALQCAVLQLLPGLNQVALIPRDVKQDGQVVRTDVTVMPQWQGYQALMLRNPEVRDVRANLVHASDGYVYDPVKAQIVKHDFDPFDEERTFKDFNDVKGGYVVIEYLDRTRPDRHHFVKKDTILKARGCAQTGDIWGKWFEEQCLKTLYRNAYARRVVPIDPMYAKKLEELLRHEDQILGNDPSRVAATDPAHLISHKPATGAADDPPKSRAEQMAGKYAGQTSETPPSDLDEPGDEDAPEEAEDSQEPLSAESKSQGKGGKGGKKTQKSLSGEETREKTLIEKLVGRIDAATNDDDLMVITDEAAEWQSQGKLTEEENQQIFEAVNQRQSEI